MPFVAWNAATIIPVQYVDVRNKLAVGTLHDLRLSDLVTFLIVSRTGSLTAAARELKVTPSQASKALARLEQHYGVKLLIRGAKGMVLSDDGKPIHPHIADAVKSLTASVASAHAPDTLTELSIAGPSYLLGIAIAAISASDSTLRLRAIELAPAQLRATITEGLFDVGLAPGDMDRLPPTWVNDEVGVLRKVLVGAPALVEALGALPLSVDQVRELPFVGALSSMGGRFAPRADDCPLPAAERMIAHRVQTFGAAVELAIRGNCVVYGPWIAVRRLLRSGELVEIPVQGWHETELLGLMCNIDVVRDRMRKQLVATLRAELVEASPPR